MSQAHPAPPLGPLLRAARTVDAIHRRLARALGWLTLTMVLLGAYNALARYLERDVGLRLSSNAFLEAQWYLFGLVFLLAAPHALRAGAHVRVDVLYGRHAARGRAWVDLCGALLLAVPFCLFGLWMSRDFVADSWVRGEMSNDPGGLPRWILKPAIPLAFGLLLLQSLSEAVKSAAVLVGRAPASILDEPPPPGSPASLHSQDDRR